MPLPGAPHRRVPALREAWFVAGVARDGDDGSLDAPRGSTAAARGTKRRVLDGRSIRRKKRTMRPERKIQTRSRCLFRRRLLGALAFAPGTVRALWPVRARGPAAVSISAAGTREAGGSGKHEENPGAGGPGLWTSPALALGAASVAEENIPVLGVFALAYAHLLEVLDDDEFFIAQTPFSLSEQRAVAAAANTLVARERLRRVPSCDPLASSASHDLALDRYWVTAACASLLRALVTRDERRSFAPDGLWLAPAREETPVATYVLREIAPPLRRPPPRPRFSGCLPNWNCLPNQSRAHRRNLRPLIAASPRSADCRTRSRLRRGRVFARSSSRTARASASARRRAAWTPTARHRANAFGQSRVYLRRDRLLEDTLSGFAPLGSNAKGRVAVTFVNAAGQEEAGIGGRSVQGTPSCRARRARRPEARSVSRDERIGRNERGE